MILTPLFHYLRNNLCGVKGPTVDGGARGDDGDDGPCSAAHTASNNDPRSRSPEKNDKSASNNDPSKALCDDKSPTSTSRWVVSNRRYKSAKKEAKYLRRRRTSKYHHTHTAVKSTSTLHLVYFSILPILCLLFIFSKCIQCVEASPSGGNVAAVASATSGAIVAAAVGAVAKGTIRKRTNKDPPPRRTKRRRTNKESTNNHPAIVFLEKCGASNSLLEAAGNLLKSEDNNTIQIVIVNLLGLLGKDIIEAADLKQQFISLKEQLYTAFMDISGAEYDGRINFGDCLSPNTALLILKHYAPDSCVGKVCKGVRNLIWRGNACILQFLLVLPRSLYKEAGGDGWTTGIREGVEASTMFIDMVLLVPKNKKTYAKEFRDFATKHGVSTCDLRLVTFIFHAIHIKYYQLVHGKSDTLTVVCASAATHDFWFDGRDEFKNDVVDNLGRIPHGEQIAARRLKNILLYPDHALEKISKQLLRAYTAIAEVVDDFNVPTLEDGSKIAQRFAGRIDMTDDEKEALLSTIRESCRLGGRNGGRKSSEMLKEADRLALELSEQGFFDTFKEGLFWLDSILGENYRKRWEATQMAPVVIRYVREQRELLGKCLTNEETLEAIEHEFGESYVRVWVKLARDATAFVIEQRNQGKCMKNKEAIAAIKEKFDDNHAQAWEMRFMVAIAAGFVKDQQQEEGKRMGHDESIAAITKEFGENYARAWEATQMKAIAKEFIEALRKKGECKELDQTDAALERRYNLN